MTYSFNLLDEKWIPCSIGDADRHEVSLLEALLESHKALEIVHPSPLVTVALHRLLLAILHRVYGPPDWRAWQAIWQRGSYNEESVRRYLEEWRHRFDLLDRGRPFYQTSGVSFDCARSTATLAHELASGNNKTLFDHTLMADPPVLTPAEAARLVVALQPYAIGGRVSYEQGREKQDGSADHALMVKGAALLATGRNLFETLMLNLVQYSSADGEPFAFDPAKDKPAWERGIDEDVEARDRLPDGYLDWLTWQSRRIRLKPETDEKGRLVVRQAVIMKGFQLPDGQWRHGRETMLAFQKKEKAAGKEEPWPALGLTEHKALWRDTQSLLQSMSEKKARPRVVDWLADLVANGALPDSSVFPLAACGLCSSKASIDFWRFEHLPIPVAYLANQEMTKALGSALTLAQHVGDSIAARIRVLIRPKRGGPRERWLWGLGYFLILPDEPAQISEEQQKGINRLEEHVSPERAFWPQLETPFKQLLVALPEDVSTDENGSTVYGARRLPEWAATLRHAAREAFAIACAAVGESARALKARAKAESVFERRLNSVLKPYSIHKEEGGEEA